MSDASRLNPEIKKIDVGKRHLRTVNVYPLSLQEQMDMTKVLVNILDEFSSLGDFKQMNEEQVFDYLKNFITTNLNQVLDLCTDPDEKPLMSELTNNQLIEIVDAIFTVNYEGLIKNSKDLFERGKGLFQKIPKGVQEQSHSKRS